VAPARVEYRGAVVSYRGRAGGLLALFALVASLWAAGYATASARPTFKGFPRKEQQRLLDRVSRAPAPYKRLLRATYSRMVIRAATENIDGDYVTVKVRQGQKHYIVDLDRETRKGGEYGDHLTLHELGHVIDHEWFDDADDNRFFDLFRQSPQWQDCFETQPGYPIPCDYDEEILADQLAFYATGNLDFRGPYDIPPLFDDPADMDALMLAGGESPTPTAQG
jgi:hypothetical protein